MKRHVLIIGIIFILLVIVFTSYVIYTMLNNSDKDSQNPVTTGSTFFVRSSAFEDKGKIPVKYCNKSVSGGENLSIPIEWGSAPDGTKSLFLVIVDTHPVAHDWLHWIVANIPIDATSMVEGASTASSNSEHRGAVASGAIELKGSNGMKGYAGPQPPVGTGDHPYEIHLFALNTEKIELSGTLTWATIQSTLAPFKVSETVYTGYFGR